MTPDIPAPLAPDAPAAFLKGRFSLFQTTDGGLLVAYRPDGETEDKHLPIPAFIVQAASQMAGGQDPAALLTGLLG